MTFEVLGGVVGGLIVLVVIGGELLNAIFAHRRRQAEQAALDLEAEDLWERVARDVDRRRAEMNAIARETDQFPKGRQ